MQQIDDISHPTHSASNGAPSASTASHDVLLQDDVLRLADYARIALTDSELTQMTEYLNNAIELLQPIRAYDLDGVEPTFHPIGDLSNVMRADASEIPTRSLPLESALQNAASVHERSFRVPSILGSNE